MWPEIDVKATENNVKRFLLRDYPRAKRMAGKNITNLQSPSINGMPSGTPVGNPKEQQIVQRAYAQQVVIATEEAIGLCDTVSQQILRMLYQKHYNDTMCFVSLHYGKSQYFNHLKPQALLQFAEAFQLGDLMVSRKKSDWNRTKIGLIALKMGLKWYCLWRVLPKKLIGY